MNKNAKLGLIGRKRLLNKKEKEKEEDSISSQSDKEKKELCEICKKEEYKYNSKK